MRSENLRRLYYHYYTTPSSPLIDPRQLSHDDLIFLAEYHLEECKQVYKLMLVYLKQHRVHLSKPLETRYYNYIRKGYRLYENN